MASPRVWRWAPLTPVLVEQFAFITCSSGVLSPATRAFMTVARGHISALQAAAGTAFDQGKTSRKARQRNVLGTLNVIKGTVPYLRANRGGSVINFASVDAFAVSPGQLLYSASKAAVVSLTKSLAVELADDHIVVNCIAPGWVDTPGNRATGRMTDAARTIPLRRVATPEEIADWVVHLAHAGYMTGETVVLSGGSVIR